MLVLSILLLSTTTEDSDCQTQKFSSDVSRKCQDGKGRTMVRVDMVFRKAVAGEGFGARGPVTITHKVM